MKSVFRLPVDHQHFKESIEQGKPAKEVLNYLQGEERVKVERIANDGLVRYWGSIPGESNIRNFEKLKPGDQILCYRSGKYIALATVAFKVVSPSLAKHTWGETELGTTWELIYFFSTVSFFEIDSVEINQTLGYADGPVMGFNAISEEKVKEFISRHGSFSELVNKLESKINIDLKISEEISKIKINSPFEAQFYLVDLGKQLEFETYVPPSDSGREVFGKKLTELISVHKEELQNYVAPAVFDPLSNIDVIWFKENYRPKYFFEVIHRTGWSEALLRLDLVGKHYESSKSRLVGPTENQSEFESALRKWTGPKDNLAYRNYEQLINVHSETLHYKNLVDEFLR